MRLGKSFESESVVACYRYRPPYPSAAFEKLLALAPGRRSLLDLGCGSGKISRSLAACFEKVTAVDASPAMLDLGKELAGGDAENIEWIAGLAEEVEYPSTPYDIVIAAESIHWMDHEVVFAKLKECVSPSHIFAIVEGDHPFKPEWDRDWVEFLKKWIPKVSGIEYNTERLDGFLRAYEEWVDVEGEEKFLSAPVQQSVQDFIACQHSRNTFAPEAMGALMNEYDAELKELLLPYSKNGELEFKVQSRVTWGRIGEE